MDPPVVLLAAFSARGVEGGWGKLFLVTVDEHVCSHSLPALTQLSLRLAQVSTLLVFLTLAPF